MKICVAQTKPVTGNVVINILNHIRLIDLAISHNSDIIIFPELSLTGYEPGLAKALAIVEDDPRLDIFQKMSDTHRIIIGIGAPIKKSIGISISMVVFQPYTNRQLYSKKYIHADEVPFFISGTDTMIISMPEIKIALAICYEISVQQHVENAMKEGAGIYIASVAKFENGIAKAISRLSDIARNHSMTVLMSNATGLADGDICAGKSSVWDKTGKLKAQLDNTAEGILVMDTVTGNITKSVLITGPES
ncbi:MAG TPA: carbon-nitrogen hydrolase family protein [Flavitalea sp.]|nr:carbon-nitrogen hydrolase family protein [Flavitalea sp.]